MPDETTASTEDLNTGPETTAPDDRPDWLDPKFTSVEEQAKAYAEAQRALHAKGEDAPLEGEKPAVDAPESSDEHEAPDDDTDPYGPVVSTALTDAGLNADEVSRHFVENGSLTEEHFEALGKAGFSRDIVEVYLAGLQSARSESIEATEAQVADIVESVGGKAELVKMAKWASINAPESAATYDRAVNTGDPVLAKMAAQHLYKEFTNRTGTKPNLVRGKSGSSGPTPFTSRAEIVEAMKAPEYRKDPAYRAEIEKRLAASSVLPWRK